MGIYFILLALSLVAPEVAYESSVTNIQQELSSRYSPSIQLAVEQPLTLPIPEILQKIALCESGGKHFTETGEVLRGTHNPDDIGKYQINEKFWGKKAQSLGFNIYTEEGNEGMALELYNRYKTKPWVWSKECWNKA